jgi:thioredoxin 1
VRYDRDASELRLQRKDCAWKAPARSYATITMSAPSESEPTKQAIEQLPGAAVIEFGTDWCGYCQAAQPMIESALAQNEQVRRIKVEDGKGRPLGRAFGVKLWPTLVFLRDGVEVARVVRPTNADVLARAFEQLS